MIVRYRILLVVCLLALLRVCFSDGDMEVNKTGESNTNLESVNESLLAKFRTTVTANIRKNLPSPHSELLLGMVVGLDQLDKVPTFNDVLKATGTVHVVVVSGYNISLIYGIVFRIVGSKYKLRNFLLGVILALVYSIISGFEPPVIRAWIMGTIAATGKYYGRSLAAMQLLLFSAACMIIANPLFFFSLSFQLSFLATLSLLLYSEPIGQVIKSKNPLCASFIGDLATTLAAQVLVLPLISNKFGRISLLSPIINTLILWTVPVSTVLGMLLVILSVFHGIVVDVFAWITYLPLDFFVVVVRTFSRIGFCSINFKISDIQLAVYYFVVFMLFVIWEHQKQQKQRLSNKANL